MILILWTILPVFLFPLLLKVKVPYGRHASVSWGPMMNNRLAWVLMELPALVVFVYFFFGKEVVSRVSWVFFFCWVLHYFYRSLIFPFKTHENKMPILIAILSFFFNGINGYFNGHYLSEAFYPLTWLYDPRFLLGIALFFTGVTINRVADRNLLHLKKITHEYQIPKGFLFECISCPNYLGEIIQWIGFAIMTWSLPGLAFALWTIANLIPRAMDHHKWYKQTFSNYPKKRKAIIPYLF